MEESNPGTRSGMTEETGFGMTEKEESGVTTAESDGTFLAGLQAASETSTRKQAKHNKATRLYIKNLYTQYIH
jgi:hypothetical protein